MTGVRPLLAEWIGIDSEIVLEAGGSRKGDRASVTPGGRMLTRGSILAR